MVTRVVFFLLLIFIWVFASTSTIDVSLKGTWKSTSLIAEASEYFAESSQSFWAFAEKVKSAENLTQQQEFELVLAVAKQEGFSSSQLALLEFALSTRYYSPQVQVFNELATAARSNDQSSASSLLVVRVGAAQQATTVTTIAALQALLDVASSTASTSNSTTVSAQLFPFDHVYNPAEASSSNLIILYSALGSKEFSEMHAFLKANIAKYRYQYVFRHYDPSSASVERKDHINNKDSDKLVTLQGYGVELQIKTLEYKQTDDTILKFKQKQDETQKQKLEEVDEMDGVVFSQLSKLYPHLSKELNSFKEHLITKHGNDSSLLLFGEQDGSKRWELKDLALQACALIMKQSTPEDQLETLKSIVQNFPSWSSTISKTSLTNADLRNEIKRNQERIEAGKNILLINGIVQEHDRLSISNLFNTLRSEIQLSNTLTKQLFVKKQDVASLLHKSSQHDSNSNDQRFDIVTAFSEQEIFYLNDIETDQRYANFPQSLQDMTLPSYWGQMRFSKRNTMTVVFIIDPTSRAGIEALHTCINFFNRGYPIRFGFIFVPTEQSSEIQDYIDSQSSASSQQIQVGLSGETTTVTSNKKPEFTLSSLSSQVIRVLHAVRGQSGSAAAVEFLFRLTQSQITADRLKSDYINMFGGSDRFNAALVGHVSTLKNTIQKAVDFFGLRITSAASVFPALYVNGILNKGYQGSAEQVFMGIFQSEYQNVLNLIRSSVLRDQDQNLLQRMLKHYNALPRLNPAIIQSREEMKFTSLNLLQINNAVCYITAPVNEYAQVTNTHIVFSDFDSKESIAMAAEAISFLQAKQSKSRFAFVHNKPTMGPLSSLFSKLVCAASQNAKLLSELATVVKNLAGDSSDHNSVSRIAPLLFKASEKITLDMSTAQKFLANTLGSNSSPVTIIVNGRVISLTSAKFQESDFELLDNFEAPRSASIAAYFDVQSFENVEPDTVTSSWRSDLVASVSSVIASTSTSAKRTLFNNGEFAEEHSVINFARQVEGQEVSIPVIAFVNPLSTEGQKLIAFVSALANFFKLPTRVYLNPIMDNSEVKVKNWYRYVLEPKLDFTESGAIKPTKAVFKQITSRNILTLGMDVPETWLIESSYAREDLDNINLHQSSHIEARYQLENIIFSGSCIDLSQPSMPPRGLQLTLTSSINAKQLRQEDTLVMANFGYFQLKANPNVFSLSLLRQHAAIYEIAEVSQNNQLIQGNTLFVNRFEGPSLTLKVKRRPGMENVELLGDDSQRSGSMWDSISTSLWGSEKKTAEATQDDNSDDEINVFSIASGHMYERLLKIMMLSVIKNTKRKRVKFWLIKNYFSPQFKQFLPLMAKHYGFKYELVTYKWPTWLNKQTQKQRIIWAYKVLFLDVLFPLKVKKIIYVDSDQVTRADMTELWETDLQGKSLGYTPFCDSRSDMEGYRFWKQGYWSSHLRGRPYHISALYVVDIDRFRKMYAGDQLRMYYDNLSKDPNSLSNLDQDLPNYAQHAVPIHSLDSSWLWCETWCSDADKKKAKTIDLCNNPMTKEHKLESARRIIPEWTSIDDEVRNLEHKLRDNGEYQY